MPDIGHAASTGPAPAARPEPATATDPFLLDGDRLRELASEAIVRRGLAYFKEGRVTDLGWSRDRLWALVDGSRPGGYQVEITLDEDGEMGVECDCPFEWEPVCKHAVATLQAYGARQPVSEVEAQDAAGAAVAARIKRGRFEGHHPIHQRAIACDGEEAALAQ